MNSVAKHTKYFEKLYAEHGDTSEALGWSDVSQAERFAVLTQIGELDRASVLDVGCGFGDFFAYLQESGVCLHRYVGVDQMPRFISVARARHYPDAIFYQEDFLKWNPADSSFGYVFGSGLFFMELDDWYGHMVQVVRKMFGLCNIGVGVNFLSVHGTNRKNGIRYTAPSAVLQVLMEEVSTKVKLIADYRKNDFTVFLYR